MVLFADIQSWCPGAYPKFPLESLRISAYLQQKGIRHIYQYTEPGKESSIGETCRLHSIQYIALLADHMQPEVLEQRLEAILGGLKGLAVSLILLKRCTTEQADHWIEKGANFICYKKFGEALTQLVHTLNTPMNPFLDQSQGLMFRNYFGNIVQNPEPDGVLDIGDVRFDHFNTEDWKKRLHAGNDRVYLHIPVFIDGESLTKTARLEWITRLQPVVKADGTLWEGDWYGELPPGWQEELHVLPGDHEVPENSRLVPWYYPEQVLRKTPAGKFGLILPGFSALKPNDIVRLGLSRPFDYQAGYKENGRTVWLKKGVWEPHPQARAKGLKKAVSYLRAYENYRAILDRSKYFHPMELIAGTKLVLARIGL